MDNTFQALECDTDILMIGKDTFTVERFKELTVEKVQTSFNESYCIMNKQNHTNISIFSILKRNLIRIVDNSVEFKLQNIELIFPPEGMDCKVLKLGNSEWQTGKMRIHVMVAGSSVRVIKLEFCYDEPPQPESPLDDIRQRENYQQLLNNE